MMNSVTVRPPRTPPTMTVTGIDDDGEPEVGADVLMKVVVDIEGEVGDKEDNGDGDTGPAMESITSRTNPSSVNCEFPLNRGSSWFLRIISCTPASLKFCEKRTIGGFLPSSVALTPFIGRNSRLLGSQSMHIP